MRLSKSGLQTYIKCPYSYYLQYEEGHRGQPSEAMLKGSEFHDLADKFFDLVSLQELANQTSIFGIESYLRSFFPEGSLYDHFAHMQTVHYMALNKKEEFMPVEREVKLVVKDIIGKDAPEWCLDVGIVDRIDQVNGETILIEYKSGKYRQGINQELMMYKDIVELTTDYKIDKLCAIYPKELYGTKLPSGVYFKSPSHEKQARAKVEFVKDMIRRKKWRQKKYSLCNWCDHADLCFEDELRVL